MRAQIPSSYFTFIIHVHQLFLPNYGTYQLAVLYSLIIRKSTKITIQSSSEPFSRLAVRVDSRIFMEMTFSRNSHCEVNETAEKLESESSLVSQQRNECLR